MGPIEMDLLEAAKERRMKFNPPASVRPFAWKPLSVIKPIDLAHSPYGPPIMWPAADVVVGEPPIKFKAQQKHIIAIVAGVFGVEACDMISARRTLNEVIPRQVGMYLCKKLTAHTLLRIGRAFGGRDHSTVLHAVIKISRIIEAGAVDDSRLIAKIDEAENAIRERFAVASDGVQ